MSEIENKIEELEALTKNLPKEKWKIWRLIAVGILFPFIGPYIPMRKGTLSERMGYQESVFLFAAIFIIVIPIACYMHFQKINNQIHDAELEIQRIKWQNKINDQDKIE